MRKWMAVMAGGLLAFVLQAPAQSSVGFTFDDDFLFPPQNKDWNYSGGLSLDWTGPQVENLHLTAPTRLLDDLLFGWTGVLEKFPNAQHTLVIGGTTYTPHDITNAAPISDDRPYASLLFAAGRIRRTDDAKEPTMAFSTELTVGMLGLQLGDQVQTLLHKDTPGRHRQPLGWSHQISDGGEPTLEYRAAIDTLVLRERNDQESDWLQAAVGAEAAAGYNTYGWAGGQVKLGRMGKDYGTPGSIVEPLAGLVANAGGGDGSGTSEAYAFARAGGFAVAYNALLEGQFRHSDVTYPSSEIEHFVDEVQFGAVLRISHLSLVYAVTRRSEEFHSDLAAAQFFGTATAAWSWAF